MQDMLLILNFNNRYAAMAARKLRAMGVCCRILEGDTLPDTVLDIAPFGMVLAGGVDGDWPKRLDGRLLYTGIPVLALGNAAASVAVLTGGGVGAGVEQEGARSVTFLPSRLTEGLQNSERMLHTLLPMTLPPGAEPIATMENEVIGFQHGELSIYALNFQLEPNDMDGDALLLRFARDICGAGDRWSESAFISETRGHIAATVPEGTAVCALTGGLDSGVAATLAHRALGERLRCFLVDTGLLRKDEIEKCLTYYRDRENLNVTLIHAGNEFAKAISGKWSDEEKRDAIRETLKRVLEENLSGVEYGAVIRGITCGEIMRDGMEEKMVPSVDKRVIAPLQDLFKEEVRYVAEKLGMPPEMTAAQPFPGTGLALRVRGEATPERLELLREADFAFCEMMEQAGLNRKLWKYFAVLYPVDERRGVIGLRAVSLADTREGETAVLPARLPYDLLEEYAKSFSQAHPEAVRVMYDISGHVNADAQWQ